MIRLIDIFYVVVLIGFHHTQFFVAKYFLKKNKNCGEQLPFYSQLKYIVKLLDFTSDVKPASNYRKHLVPVVKIYLYYPIKFIG